MCMNSRNQLYIHGEVENKGFHIRWFDRNNGCLIKEIKCQCYHTVFTGSICEHPLDPNVILETCYECQKIRSYDMNTGRSADIYTGAGVWAICTGPAGTILGADVVGHILQFRWKDDGEDLELVQSVKTSIADVQYMCHDEQNNVVFLSGWHPGRVCAVKLSDGATLWEFNQKINREDIKPFGLCHDADGRIYIVVRNGGIITIDSRSGKLLQHLHNVSLCYDICWISASPQLTLLHGWSSTVIRTFEVIDT